MNTAAATLGTTASRWWARFWFEPMASSRLGIVRGLYFAGILYVYRMEWPAPSWWGNAPDAFWAPLDVLRFVDGPASAHTLEQLRLAFLVALAAAALGIFTRVSLIATFVLGLLYCGYPYNFGTISHSDASVVLISFVLMFSRCGDSWSFDAVVRNLRRRRHPFAGSADESPEYGWPLKAIWLVIAFVMFSAGVTKLVNSGPAWVTSDTMAIWLTDSNAWHFYRGVPPTRWGLRIASMPIVPHVMAAAALLLELAFPLVLFSRRARWILVPGAIAFNLGVYVLMSPYFPHLIWANCVVWIPWHRLAARFSQRTAGERRADRVQVAPEPQAVT